MVSSFQMSCHPYVNPFVMIGFIQNPGSNAYVFLDLLYIIKAGESFAFCCDMGQIGVQDVR
jgi:hypothetical protein